MTRVSAVDARSNFSDIINRAAYGKERVVLTRRGKDLAAVVPVDDLELLQEIEDRKDLDDALAALREAKEKGTLPWDKVKAELGIG